jgi:tRNA threonylcarbamoyladenosine biosynthesis protein TsaE
MTVVACFYLPDEDATERAGTALGQAIGALSDPIERGGLVIGLSGDLGAGKTAWVRAALRALGVSGPVKSPSFSILEVYVVSRLNLYHFDFYRFKDPSEFSTAGFREFFGAGAICAIEWPQNAAGFIPAPDLSIELTTRESGRLANLSASTTVGELCLNRLTAQLKDLTVAATSPMPIDGA